MSEETEVHEERLKPFSAWLAEHRRGLLDDELADRLSEVVLAVRQTGKSGKIRLEVAVDPKGRSVVVTDQITVKVPEPDREAAVYFGDAKGELVKDDPDQARLPLEHITNADGGLSVVDAETGELRRVEGERA